MQVREPITYSTKPVTLGEARWMQEAMDGSFAALINLIAARTDMTEQEASAIEVADIQPIALELAATIGQATILSKLGLQLTGEANA